MAPRLSLIIVTLGERDNQLRQCLASIERQSFRDVETIIVDQGKSEVVQNVLARLSGVRRIPAPRLGLSACRNIGVLHARGDVVGFPDDDAALAEGSLERVDAAFRAQPDLGFLTGCGIDPSTGRRIFRFPPSPATLSVWNVLTRHCSTTLFVRRELLEQNVFDPMLGVGAPTPFGAAEETDLVYRLLLANTRGRYDPSVVVLHPNTELVSLPIQKVLSYGLGTGACFRKLRDRFGWWPIGALWLWMLVRAFAGVVAELVRGRRTRAALRAASIRARLRGWQEYSKWRGILAPLETADHALEAHESHRSG